MEIVRQRQRRGEEVEVPYKLGYGGPSTVDHGHGNRHYNINLVDPLSLRTYNSDYRSMPGSGPDHPEMLETRTTTTTRSSTMESANVSHGGDPLIASPADRSGYTRPGPPSTSRPTRPTRPTTDPVRPTRPTTDPVRPTRPTTDPVRPRPTGTTTTVTRPSRPPTTDPVRPRPTVTTITTDGPGTQP